MTIRVAKTSAKPARSHRMSCSVRRVFGVTLLAQWDVTCISGITRKCTPGDMCERAGERGTTVHWMPVLITQV